MLCENRHVVFFWKPPGKGVRGVLYMLERAWEVWEGFKDSPMDSGLHCVVLVCLATLCWSSLGFVDLVFTDDAVALVHLAFFTDHHLLWLCSEKGTRELLMIFWWLLPFLACSESNCHCCFMNGVCEWIELPLLMSVSWAADILIMKTGTTQKNYF